jgi:hypothetical protein
MKNKVRMPDPINAGAVSRTQDGRLTGPTSDTLPALMGEPKTGLPAGGFERLKTLTQ